GVVLPLALAHHYDALRIPRSDDWAFLRVLFQWDRTGAWRFNNWVAMTLVGQVVLAEPVVKIFGESITAVRVFAAVLGLLGLLAVVALGRGVRLRRGAALLVAVVIAAQRMWGPLAATYMTDLPSFAFQMAALAAGVRALRGPRVSIGWLAVALATADVSFT